MKTYQVPLSAHNQNLLKGIEYNSSTKGKGENTNEIVTTKSRENCESEKWDTEVENDKKVSFDNVTNVG